MDTLIPFVWLAGGLQLGVASANFFAARLFQYRRHLKTLPRHVAEVFVVQNVFIVFTVVGMAALCFFAAPELSGATALGRGLSAFLSLFWWARLFFQLFYYDRDVRRRYRVVDALFVVAFVYLAVVFALGASAGLIEP